MEIMNSRKVRVTRTRSVKVPSKGTRLSAGLDLYVPDFDETFFKDFLIKNPYTTDLRNPDPYTGHNAYEYILFGKEKITLSPGNKIEIPMGIKFHIPEGYMFLAENKSGVSFKQGLDRLACIIDADYSGEIFVTLHNCGLGDAVISSGQKIIQLALVEVPQYDVEEVDEDFLLSLHYDSERGEGSQGSTGLFN